MVKPLKDYAAPLKAFDRVVKMDESGIITQKLISISEPFFLGHYPDNPVYPGVFIIESVQQTVKHYAAKHYGLARLVEIVSVRFLKPVLPGHLLETRCDCIWQPDNRCLKVKAICYSHDSKVAELKINFCIDKEL
ncbi:MAG: hypothetical protein RLZZ04_3981 [Cyanobacteriota bacterium]|jgi:3-hydroxymyristoyl/3-hydroxydecanoyl-(acyl carrier protein) dehydratase